MSGIPIIFLLSFLALLSPSTCQKKHQKSLVIVFDGTGSMHDDLVQLVPAANTIIQEYAGRPDKPIYNYILTVFHDPTIDPTINSQNPEDLKVGLSKIELHNKGDIWPSGEKSITGLIQSLEHALPQSIVFLITDDEGNDYAKEPEVMKILQKKQITVYVLLADRCQTFTTPGCKVYETISRSTNGLLFNMDSTDVQKVLQSLTRTIDPDHVEITIIIEEAAGVVQKNVSVDQSIQEICASVSGKNPKLTILGADKVKLQLISELTMDRYKFGCVENKNSGLYEFQASADSGFTTKIDARSKLKFDFGFSIEPVKVQSDTNTLPLIGHQNILTIFPSDATQIQTISDVFIQTGLVSARVEKNLLLKKVNEGAYATEKFQLPNEPFTIRMRALDSLGVPIDRIISGSLVSESGSAPEVSVESTEISLCTNEKFLLKCNVKSQIPVDIKWTFNGLIKGQESANQSKEVRLELDQFDISEKGNYKCEATNRIGSHSKTISVNIFKMPRVQMVAATTELTEYLDVNLNCDIKDVDTSSVIKWIDEDGNVLSEGQSTFKFTPLRKYDGKSIICQVTNPKCSVRDSKIFTVKYLPIFKDQTLSAINQKSLKFSEHMELNCESDRNPRKHKIHWFLHTKNNKTIEQTDQIGIDKIEIIATKATDGIFECVIKNDLDPVKRQFNITVSALEPPKVTTPLNLVTFNETEEVELFCECTKCLPITKATWTYEPSNNIKISELTNGNNFKSLLTISNVDRSQAGKFKCKLENNLGSDETELQLVIQTPPKIENITIEVDKVVKKVDQEVQILEGSDLKFECNVDSLPLSNIYFTFNGTKLINDKTLSIKNITTDHEGTYECIAENIVKKAIKKFKLTLNTPPKLKSTNVKEIHFNHKTQASITCDIYGHPKPQIKWTFNGNEIYGSFQKYDFKNDRYTLEFAATDDDEGTYTCEGENEFGKTSMDFEIVVKTTPIFKIPTDENIKIKKGSTLELICEATAVPPPTIKFIRGGLVLLSSTKFTKENIQMTDAGVYHCVAENNVGSSTKNYSVTVVEPPSFTKNFADVTLIDEQFTEVECEAEGIPKPDLKWFFGESTLMSENSKLFLNTSNDRGFYNCVAENSEGKDSRKFYADIRRLNPYKNISEVVKDLTIKENENLELLCPYKNFETLKWTFNNKKMPTDLNSTIIDNKLTIHSIKRDHDGIFTCKVTDPRDIFNFTFKVEVLSVPIMKATWMKNNKTLDYPQESDIEEHQFNLNDKMKISCEANGNPKPVVTWFKSNLMVIKNEHLVNDNLDHDSSGIYSCTAHNSQEAKKKFFKIDVIGAPNAQSNELKKFEAKEGEKLKFDCFMNAAPPPKYLWFKNRERLEGETSSTLTLENITLKDDATYLCLAFNNHGATEQNYQVSVLEKPKIVEPSDDELILRNSTFTLTCVVRANPIPQFWWSDNKEVVGTSGLINDEVLKELEDNSFVYFNEDGTIIKNFEVFKATNGISRTSKLSKVDDKNFKFETTLEFDQSMQNLRFTCMALNSVGRDLKSIIVQKYEKPHDPNNINSDDSPDKMKKRIKEGNRLELNCPFVGNPYPTYQWSKNGEKINENEKTLKFIEGGKKLVAEKSLESHTGFYSCIASNQEGRQMANFEVIVNTPPSLKSTSNNKKSKSKSSKLIDESKQTLDVMLGSNAILECWTEGTPKPKIFWQRVYPKDPKSNKVLKSTENILIIQNIKEIRYFICYANNTYGSVQKSFTINPLYPPVFDKPGILENIVKTEGDKVILDCSLKAKPDASVKWLKDTKNILENSEYFFTAKNRVLVIEMVELHHNGIYICNASNEHGFIVRTFNLKVEPDVTYTPWSEWSKCEGVCDTIGTQYRNRKCSFKNPIEGVVSCPGELYQMRKCKLPECWSDWGKWDPPTCPTCKKTYQERHVQWRTRYCKEKNCKGDYSEMRECDIQVCAQSDDWEEWSHWKPGCPLCYTFGKTKPTQSRKRSCQKNNGNCPGKGFERRECEIDVCIISGGWTEWSEWSKCSRTCGYGVQKRYRTCTAGKGKCSGGSDTDSRNCKIKNCNKFES